MKLIEFLESKPTFFLALAVIFVSIIAVVLIALILYRLESEKKVRRSALELNELTKGTWAGLVHFVMEYRCRILYASKGFYEILGYTQREAIANSRLNLLDFIHPKDNSPLHNIQALLSHETFSCEVKMLTREGNILYALFNGKILNNRNGKHTVSAVLVDVTRQKQMQERILLEGEKYRIATELSKDIIFEYDILSDELVLTDKFKDLFGRDPIIKNLSKQCDREYEAIHPDDWGIFLELCLDLSNGKSIIEHEFRIKDSLGEYIWCQIMGKTIYDDDKVPLRVIGKMVNVDIQKKELESLIYKATRDPLTGVYNKEATVKKIEKFINGNKSGKHTLMFIDFDDFKKVNDSYGHLLGDKVLSYVVERIRQVFTEGEIIGRIGGDEFVVFSGNVLNMNAVLEKANQLIRTLDTTYNDNDIAISITGSIGIASYPEDGLHCEQLLERADKALYRVKEQGKNNYLVYDSTI